MGNCMLADSSSKGPLRVTTLEAPLSVLDVNQSSMLSRFEAVQGTLFFYRSTILRHLLHVQREANRKIKDHNPEAAVFALKRQKLLEAVLTKIDEYMDVVKEGAKYSESSKKKKHCVKLLSNAYQALEDIGKVIKLEDNLQSKKPSKKSKEELEEFFKKYEVEAEKTEDMGQTTTTAQTNRSTNKFEPAFDGIPLTSSTCIKKSSIPNFTSQKEIPIAIAVEASS